jgi:hypothetical protein
MRMPYAVARRKLSDDPLLHAAAGSFWNRPDDWTRIEKVLERIETRCSGKIPGAWVSKKELKRLRATANSDAEAGGTGRHANPKFRALRKPMPLREAQQISFQVAQERMRQSQSPTGCHPPVMGAGCGPFVRTHQSDLPVDHSGRYGRSRSAHRCVEGDRCR